ncbi:hypothetical protein BB934_08295 [Microvirga ossetica]|uniref:Uncharacterized protein n=1 Tax=Microvirga ossetica TaxID=1882682 RepID=A0A1B2EEC4_9HYPH|nr:hypothetical protein [Microvirga ossetica]ANY78232.1 hypothetical protein BB934_08295 [Microvirga ossetica]
MNNDNSGAIVFLLAAILCVLLFGSGAVLSGLGWGVGIVGVLAIGFFILAGIARFFGAMRDEMAASRARREPWLWLFVVWPASRCFSSSSASGRCAGWMAASALCLP